MKQLLGTDIDGSYLFDPIAKTITLLGISFTLENILLITNVTRNTIIYNFADSTNGATSFTNNVLTLDHNTSAHNANDVLQIFVDIEENALTKFSSTDEQIVFLRRIAKLIETQAANDGSGRQRVVLDSGTVTTVTTVTTVSTVTTCASVTNVAALAGYDQRLYVDWARQAYNTGIRQHLTFS